MKRDERPSDSGPVVHNRDRIDDEFSLFPIGEIHHERDIVERAPVHNGPGPRIHHERIRWSHRLPAKRPEIGANQRCHGLIHSATERIVCEDDQVLRIDHHHTLRQGIERRFHTCRNNAGWIELTERALHEKEVADEPHYTHKRKEAYPWIGKKAVYA